MSKNDKKGAEVEEEENYEDILKGMVKQKGVRGWIVVNYEGIPIKHQVKQNIFLHKSNIKILCINTCCACCFCKGYSEEEAIRYAGSIMALADKAAGFLKQPFVHAIIPENTSQLQTLQLRTHNNEIIVVPDSKGECFLNTLFIVLLWFCRFQFISFDVVFLFVMISKLSS